MNENEKLLEIITRLLAPFGLSAGQGDEALDGYLIGLRDVPLDYVAMAVANFLGGKVERADHNFAPKPPEVALEARRLWHHDLRLQEVAHPRLPPPDIEKTPESRARVKAKMAEFIHGIGESLRTDDAKAAQRRKAIFERGNTLHREADQRAQSETGKELI
jgi:hypothetical protein